MGRQRDILPGNRQMSYESLKNAAEHDKTASSGASKILGMCKQARVQRIDSPVERIDWVWIDTCCIDKSSSAELGKAINSMFKWYQEAQVCYAHMNDVEWNPKDPDGSRQSTWRILEAQVSQLG